MTIRKTIESNGNIVWRNGKGEVHRTNGPAVIYPSGVQQWFKNGLLHRENDEPAHIGPEGSKEWYIDGKHHRTDGPAIMYPDGYRSWYLNGQYHRTNGPARIFSNGTEEWYLNGVCHRTNGPAVTDYKGKCEYWLNGVQLKISPNLKNLFDSKHVVSNHNLHMELESSFHQVLSPKDFEKAKLILTTVFRALDI